MQINMWKLKIDLLSLRATIKRIEFALINKLRLQHIVINAAKVVNAQNDKLLRNAINHSDIVNIDGMSIVWSLRMLGYNVPERLSGIDLFEELLELAEKKGYKPFFFGATEEVLQKMIILLNQKYPTMEIAGYINGFYQDRNELNIAYEIRDSGADLLFLGITSPKKEIFIDKYSDIMNIPFIMGVGGSFDIISGKTQRAPSWMQQSGLEWLYRIHQEPRRMWKRYVRTNTLFIIMFVKELVRKSLYSGDK